MVAHIYNPSTQEAEDHRSTREVYNAILSQTQNDKNEVIPIHEMLKE